MSNKGSSPVKSAAYELGIDMVRQSTGERCRYRRKERVVARGVALPADAPAAYKDPEFLWNENERLRVGAEAPAYVYECSLPRELDRPAQIELVKAYTAKFTDEGKATSWAIHDSNDGNPHAHVLVSSRKVTPQGFDQSKKPQVKLEKWYLCKNVAQDLEYWVLSTEWDYAKKHGFEKVFNWVGEQRLTKSEAKAAGMTIKNDRVGKDPVTRNVLPGKNPTDDTATAWAASQQQLKDERKEWELLANEHIKKWNERTGAEVNLIDCRSLKEQGSDHMPTVHVGWTKGKEERQQLNEQIKQYNSLVDRLKAYVTAAAKRVAEWTQQQWWKPTKQMLDRAKQSIQQHKRSVAYAWAAAPAEEIRAAAPAQERPSPNVSAEQLAEIKAAGDLIKQRQTAQSALDNRIAAAEHSKQQAAAPKSRRWHL